MSLKKKSKLTKNLRFLERTHISVRDHLSTSVELPDFLETAGKLTLAERKRIVAQALLLLHENFVHLPFKKAMHGVDPVQRLKVLQLSLEQSTPQKMGPEFAFHREMIDIFTSVRDLHTNYLLPEPFAGRTAYLPFVIEEYFDENGRARFLASHFVQGFAHTYFKKGVEVISWNGVPISRAVDVSAELHAGSNEDARHVRGIDGLTIRGLTRTMPPDEIWVDVGYIDHQGEERETRQEWIVSPALPLNSNVDVNVDVNVANMNAASQGLDIEADAVQRTKMMLFAPKALERQEFKENVWSRKATTGSDIPSKMPGVFRAQSVTTASGEYGHIRIFTFSVDNPAAFIDEFVRLASLLPQIGLIVDVRGNGGGHIFASEGLLQVLTPRKITPEPTQFICTALNERICARHKANPVGIDLGPWLPSLEIAVKTGSVFSSGFSITPHDFANERGQRYHGPVLVITDARCYSATDIFAAGFQDHKIGPILGVDDNTGAGGANVWTHELLKLLLEHPEPADSETPYEELPKSAGLRVAIRRTLRVGEQIGIPLEDLGVKPDVRHTMTRDDLLKDNVDLMNHAGKILAGMDVYQLNAKLSSAVEGQKLSVSTDGLDRIDIYIDARPISSHNVVDGKTLINVPNSGVLLEIMGFDNNKLSASSQIELSSN